MNQYSTKIVRTIGLGLAVLALALVPVMAGDLDPPGPPAPTMVTLQEIFDAAKPSPPDTCFDDTGNRFVDCGDGTIKDTETGLFWLKDADCFLETWANANIEAAELAHGQCGLTDGSLPGDWRLPTLGCPPGPPNCVIADATGEFASVFAPSCPAPHILDTAGSGCWSEGNPFSGVQSFFYWSATSASDPIGAWAALLNTGIVAVPVKPNGYFVWPVRGGP